MLCGLVLFKFLYLELLGCIGGTSLHWLADVNLYSSIWTIRLCSWCICSCIYSWSILPPIKIAPWFQTAGFGVFAGRAFKKDEVVLWNWMTLPLPKNGPNCKNYVFTYNETHAALILDYGSVTNHHESANVQAIHFPDVNDNDNIHFQVRRGFQYANHNALKICSMHACMHACIST